jgi:hypothetical protein
MSGLDHAVPEHSDSELKFQGLCVRHRVMLRSLRAEPAALCLALASSVMIPLLTHLDPGVTVLQFGSCTALQS